MTWQPELWGNYSTNVAEADDAEERHSKHTQRWLVQTHLESGRTLTALEALDKYGINRLAARVNELRNAKVAVQSRMVTVASGKRVAEYYIGEGDE
jgi:hypothetical protein